MTKILLATPAYGEMFLTPYVSSVIRLQRLMTRNKWDLSFASIAYADIVESRNFLLTHFYDKTDATHLLFIDADMGYEAELVADMVKLCKPVVGAVYPKRQIDLTRLAGLAAKGEKAELAIARAHDFLIRPLKRIGKPRMVNGFIEVDGCGAGLLLIERSCIKTMLEKLPELSDAAAKKTSALAHNLDRLIRAFEPMTVDGARLSEDFSFCHRWRAACGGEVWANVSRAITHAGLHRFSARYQDAMPQGPRIRVGSARAGAAQAAGKPGTSKPSVVAQPADAASGRIAVKEGVIKRTGTVGRSATTPRVLSRLSGALPRKDKPNGG
jgi:hypothetical protein